MSENNGGSMMGGFLLGAVVGAGLALIFAPMAGDETRRRLGDTARKLKDGARGQLDGMKGQLDGVKDAIAGGVNEVSSAVDAGREAYRQNAGKSPMAKEHV